MIVVVAAVTIALLGAPSSRPRSRLRYPVVIAVVLVGCAVLYRREARRALPRSWCPPSRCSAHGLVACASWGPDLEAAYGAFASVVMVMLWLWISGSPCNGAHVTASHQPTHGTGISNPT